MTPRIDTVNAEVFDHLLARYGALPTDPLPQRWLLLEAAHVVGQTRIGPHLRSHMAMLGLAWETGDRAEIGGQLFRLALVPLGHLLRRLPHGNSGRAHISAFQPMQPSSEILQVISQSRQKRL